MLAACARPMGKRDRARADSRTARFRNCAGAALLPLFDTRALKPRHYWRRGVLGCAARFLLDASETRVSYRSNNARAKPRRSRRLRKPTGSRLRVFNRRRFRFRPPPRLFARCASPLRKREAFQIALSPTARADVMSPRCTFVKGKRSRLGSPSLPSLSRSAPVRKTTPLLSGALI